MPNIFEQYNSSVAEQEEKTNTPIENAEQFNAAEELNKNELPLPNGLSGNPKQQEINENRQYSQQRLGALESTDLVADPESWSPEFTMKGFAEESGNSIMRGIGTHILKGTGDMLQVAGGLFDPTISDGSWFSRALQDAGTGVADKFQAAIPEALQGENITWGSMTNPKFWSITVAEMIPQLAEFIFLSKGGGALAKKGLGAALKGAKGVTKTALKQQVKGTGKGLIGKLATDQGLTQLGSGVAGAVGGGITGNVFSGMLNAAEVVNSNKDLKDADGNLVYTEEELGQMASGTMRKNANWMLADIASWGMTYGGGWKALRGLNPVAKGGKVFNTAQKAKISSNIFRYDIAPVAKSLARLGGKAGAEGVEEMFQETYEEWAKKKAVAEVTGEELEYDNYMDFYNSKENLSTKVVSFALGALGGAAFNVSSLINQTADDTYKLHNRMANLTEIVDKQGTEEELSWQEYHIRQTIADIVIDDKMDLYEEFSTSLVEDGNITEDEKARYDEMAQNFQDVKAKGKRLNVKGLTALMHNNAEESYIINMMAQYENIAKESIADIQAEEGISDIDKAKEINKIENVFTKRMKAASIKLAESKQNQANLIIGKLAKPLKMDLVLDEFGNEYIVGGVSTEQAEEQLLKKGETLEDSIDAIDDKKPFKMPTMGNLGQKGKDFVNKIMSSVTSAKDAVVDKVVNKDKKEDVSQEQENIDEAIAKTKQQFDADIIIDPETGEVTAESTTPDLEPIEKESIEKGAVNFYNEYLKGFKKEEKKEPTAEETKASEQAEEQAQDKVDIEPIIDENETIDDKVFNNFQEKGEVDKALLSTISDKINNTEKLTAREDEIRRSFKNEITENIAAKILGTETNTEGVVKRAEPPKPKVEKEEKLNKEENAFVKDEVTEEEGEAIEDAQKKKDEKAKKDFKIDPKKVKDSENTPGLDKREKKQSSIRDKNLKDYNFTNKILGKLRTVKITESPDISQSELDNYLNRTTTYNLVGPSDLDRMAVVNHQLKRMFPNTNDPAQALIVRNLFESIGSQGLGHTLGATIYIDTKVWNQDKIFMHEMSHILYKLSLGEDETNSLLKSAMADKERVNKIKSLYDDYTLYNVVIGEELVEMTKGTISSHLLANGFDKNGVEQMIQKEIREGSVQVIPFANQRYLKEELFVSMLEGPLSEKFDKIFNAKNEPKRQADVKKWWGLLRKRGAIIEQEDGVDKMLRELAEDKELPQGDLKDYLFNTFKAVTKGVKIDSFGLDARAERNNEEYNQEIANIAKRKAAQKDNSINDFRSLDSDEDATSDLQDSQEEDGVSFDNKDFDSHKKATGRILRRFGTVYNKALRKKFLLDNKDNTVNRKNFKTFEKDLFESTIYNLATENNRANDFIYNIENSAIQEVQAFNRFLNKVHPKVKYQLLNSMHTVLSNSKHIVGFKNTLKDNGDYQFRNSLAQREQTFVNNIIDDAIEIKRNAMNGIDPLPEKFKNFEISVENIRTGKDTKQDYYNVIDMFAPSNFKLHKVLEQGVITYKGVSIPIETLISGYIKKGLLFQNTEGSKQIYYGNGRALAEALVATNRKFTPISSVKNAEGNMEPVRITNNHITKEIDNMIAFMAPDHNGKKKTKEQFLKRYSHLGYVNPKSRKKNYVHNPFLENIYDQYQNGVLPTISQYHGIEDISNNKGSLYKNSTAIEQTLEDLLIFENTSRNKKGEKLNSHLANMGTFADSPRKFFINAKTINFSDIFSYKGNKPHFKADGSVLNSMFQLHNKIYEDKLTDNRVQFKKELINSIQDRVAFINKNGKELSSIGRMRQYFKNNKLNKKGQELIAEQVINSIANGYNMTEVFLHGIKATKFKNDLVKRYKMNSSPILSAKNENFRYEPIFFADEIVNNSIAGTDSGMFITQKSAEKLQALGKGVFEMNNGFKLLNASVEKNNINFRGKTAYLKGYTTIVDKTHPMFKVLTAMEDKYDSYHEKKYGEKPTLDLSDGSFNHIAIAIPQSSDKSNFSPTPFTKKVNGELIHTPEGAKMTPEALAQNIDEAMKSQEKLYYSKAGVYKGIESYNFGPQQLMDKVVNKSTTPVQMVNSVIVNAAINGQLQLAQEIQEHIANQKKQNLDKVVEDLQPEEGSNLAKNYKIQIEKGLNKEDMDQAQRMMLEDGGSISHPYVNEIIVNQLTKTIRREGNKLSTPGTNAHQKPDLGYRMSSDGKLDSGLKGYGKNTDGSLSAAEIVLPNHMMGKVKARKTYTIYTHKEALARNHKRKGIKGEYRQDLEVLKTLAVKHARTRAFEETGNANNYEKFMAETLSGDVVIGYHVKGETIIASRVPGHGPSSTGVFEAIGFDEGAGNQVMVGSEFNDIIGSDNDGDSLFIQTKGDKKEYAEWNQAFTKMTQYWLSKEMAEQVQSKMVFQDKIQEINDKINEQFPQNKKYTFPFSPQQRMKDYNNTMVSKRNIGPVFNLHKITNLLAAYEIKSETPININRTVYRGFEDIAVGEKSRNQQSAILANIILDNAKDGFADALGLDEHNIAQAVLLVNMGVPLLDVGRILNSPAAKLWSEKNRTNNSMFHDSKNREKIVKEIYADLKIKRTKNTSLKIQTNVAGEKNQQARIIELFSYLSDMNSEIQKISAIMSGHKKIHTNPLVLAKQLKDFKETINGTSENKTLQITDEFKTNPDLKHYVAVAEEALVHLERINPVYRGSTNKLLERLTKKIGSDLSVTQIEAVSRNITKFNTSRLLGHNNIDIQYAKDLITPGNPNSIFSKLDTYLSQLRDVVVRDDIDLTKNVTKLHNSVLFHQALNLSLKGNDVFIRANADFVNDSLNEIERERAQEEFQELPTTIKDDLILYDIMTRGLKGKQSLAPFFDRDTNFWINMASNEDLNNKNDEISPVVMNKLENIIALKLSMTPNNPYHKVYVKGNLNINKKETALNAIFESKGAFYTNPELIAQIGLGQPMYINVRKSAKVSALYEIEEFTKDEFEAVDSERSMKLKRARILELAKKKLKLVPNNLTSINNKMTGELDLALISDKNTREPYKTYPDYISRPNLDPLVEATITFDEIMAKVKEQKELGMDAREDFDSDTFSKKEALTLDQYSQAMEFKDRVSTLLKTDAYNKYTIQKKKANEEAKTVLDEISNADTKTLLSMYEDYGTKDVYAYSIILTPIVKKLASNLASEQSKLTKREANNKDISFIKAHMISGSTIPSNHPAAQGLARMLEKEYKTFINEKKKYISEMNDVSEALYKDRLGYGGQTGLFSIQKIKNTAKRIRDIISGVGRQDIYQRLYGNLVIRKESVDDKGRLTYNFKFKPQKEIEQEFKDGILSKAEKDFYDHFRRVTKELEPPNLKEKKEDYIPHTSMTKMEVFSNRGLLGLMVNSKPEDIAIYDVKLRDGEKLTNFKTIEDRFKQEAATSRGRNNINKMIEYRKLKSKAKRLLKSGKNEDGSNIIYAPTEIETALGFGAINRFANNRSVKATELPSMDLNKALGDYIHSSLFVTGNEKFVGMQRLQGYIDGVLAHNRDNNLPNMNHHVQKVWKDYFLRGQRQTSFMGKKADKVVLGLTRLNLFYALGYQANKNTGGLYAIGNVLAGKYHNIKDIGGKAWIRGELLHWGLDKGFEGGISGVIQRRKRMSRIMKSMNFMEINVYDQVNMEKKNGLDAMFADLALAPMIYSEKWIQQVHMIGLLTNKELDYFDEAGNYKNDYERIHEERLIQLEDQVKSSHGRGYQPTDQRAVQMYSWGNMMLQFSRFIPTMFHDRFAKADVNIYGKDTIGTLTAVGSMVRYVMNNPKDYIRYRKSLSEEQRKRLDSGMKGMAMAAIISIAGATVESDTANQLFWDTNYYWSLDKLGNKTTPAAIQSTSNLVGSVF